MVPFCLDRDILVTRLNGCNSLPGNYHQRHGHLVFNGHGGHGFHGQHLGHAVFQIHFADGDAVKKLCIAGKEDQLGLEIDFRDVFTRLEGFPDALKGFLAWWQYSCLG